MFRFGFITRHIRAYRQDARVHPVLPDEQRSHGDVSRTHQIGMERILTVLTDKQQAFGGTIGVTGMSTSGTSLAGRAGIYLNRHASLHEDFTSISAVQFCNRPSVLVLRHLLS